MPDDVLRRVSWTAGEMFVHGSESHVKHVAAEYLLARMKVEPARRSCLGCDKDARREWTEPSDHTCEKEGGDGTRTSTAQGDE